MKAQSKWLYLMLLGICQQAGAGGFLGNDTAAAAESKKQLETVSKIEPRGLVEALSGLYINDFKSLKDYHLRVGGALVAGISYNPASPTDRSNYPVAFNDRSNEVQLNRFRLFVQRDVNVEGKDWDIGGRFDFIIGSDARYTMTAGLDDKLLAANRFNRVAFPQFYTQIFAPYGNGITVQIGHFFTLIGSISPFNSVSYVAYSEPSTHTGVLFSTPINDHLTISAGAVLGTFNTFDNFGKNLDVWNFLGSTTWTQEKTTATVSLISGDNTSDGSLGLSQLTSNRTHVSVAINQDFAEKWHYKFQHDYGYQAKGFNEKAARWYGIEQDLMYDLPYNLTAGLRAEWFRDQNGLKVMLDGLPATYYSVTAGLFWKPTTWITVRPELRYDVSNNPVYNDLTDRQQFTFTTSVIVKL